MSRPRSFLYDVCLEKIDNVEFPFGIQLTQAKDGFVVQQVFDSIKISTVFDEAISILPFDVLVAVDKVDVIGSTLDEVLYRLRSSKFSLMFRFRRNLVNRESMHGAEICVHLKGLNGEDLRLTVSHEEDKYTAIQRFVEQHGLPEKIIPKLIEKLVEVQQIHEDVPTTLSPQKNSLDEVDSTMHNSQAESSFVQMLRMGRAVSSPLKPIKRSLSLSSLPSIKQSSSPKKLKNENFFNDMYEEAARSRERKRLLKELDLKNRMAEIQHSSFRDSKSSKPRSEKEVTNSFVELYSDHTRWLQRRNEHIKNLKLEQEKTQEESFQREFTFSPKLETSFANQVKRSATGDKFYDSLYSWQGYFQKRAAERKIQEQRSFSLSAPFTPKVNRGSGARGRKKTLVNTEPIPVSDHKTPSQPREVQESDPEFKLIRNHQLPARTLNDDVPNRFTSARFQLNYDTVEMLRSNSLQTSIDKNDERNFLREFDLTNQEVFNETKGLSPNFETSPERFASDFDSEFDSAHFADEPLNVFDRLYSNRMEYSDRLKRLQLKHQPAFTHAPDIGVNHNYQVEQHKSDFFLRLHKHFEVRQMEQLRHRIETEVQAEAEKTKISSTAAFQVVERLLMKQTKVDEFRQSKHENFKKNIKYLSNSKFISSNSSKLIRQRQNEALAEIFNVLIVTTFTSSDDFQELKNDDVPKIEPNQEMKTVKRDVEVLDITKADPSYLNSKDLSTAISVVLRSFAHEKDKVSLPEFIDRTVSMMSQGRFPPINHLLTPLSQYYSRLKLQGLDISSEELSVRDHLQKKPILVAEKVTNKLTAHRYKERKLRKVSIEDSLLSYIEINEQRRRQLQAEIEEDIDFSCTFKPCLYSSCYQREFGARKNQRSQSR